MARTRGAVDVVSSCEGRTRTVFVHWAPAEAGQILRLTNYDPALRGAVIYPPAFDDLE